MDPILIFIPFLFLIVFSGLFAFVSKLFSLIGGWSRLAQHYQSDTVSQEKMWNMQSGRMGIASYRSVLKIGVDRSRFFLGVFILFRIGHPNLSIPLQDIAGKEQKGIFFTYVRLTFRKAPGVTLTVMKNLGDKIELGCNGAWRYERLN